MKRLSRGLHDKNQFVFDNGVGRCRGMQGRTFRVLIDGYTAIEEPDGTIRVEDKKIYLQDKNGEPLGAAWHDVWISSDGTIVRKSDKLQKASDL